MSIPPNIRKSSNRQEVGHAQSQQELGSYTLRYHRALVTTHSHKGSNSGNAYVDGCYL